MNFVPRGLSVIKISGGLYIRKREDPGNEVGIAVFHEKAEESRHMRFNHRRPKFTLQVCYVNYFTFLQECDFVREVKY